MTPLRSMLILLTLAACTRGQPEGPPTPSPCGSGLTPPAIQEDCDDPLCARRIECRGAWAPWEPIELYRWAPPQEGMNKQFTNDSYPEFGDIDGDGLLDLGAALAHYSQPGYPPPPPEGDSWLALWPSSHGGPLRRDLQEAPLTFPMGTPTGAAAPFNTACDLDGDGYDDIVARDQWVDIFSNIIELNLFYVLPGGPDPGPVRRLIPSESTFYWASTMTCVGDVDGDGGDDILTWEFSERAVLLSGRQLLALPNGADMAPAVMRYWGRSRPGASLLVASRGAGDIDGDGLPDISFGPPTAVQSEDPNPPEAVLLPGSPDLGQPEFDRYDLGDEQPAWWTIRLPHADGPVSGGIYGRLTWLDFTGDGRPDLLRKELDNFVTLVDNSMLSGDRFLRLGDEDVVRWALSSSYRVSDQIVQIVTAGDLNGDGLPDAIAVGSSMNMGLDAPVVDGPDSSGVFGVFVKFGTGRLEDFAVPITEWDVVAAAPQKLLTSILQLDGDRDGDGVPDLVLWGGAPVDDDHWPTAQVASITVLSGASFLP